MISTFRTPTVCKSVVGGPFVQHHSAMNFVYIMALYNTKLARWRHLLSQCDTNWASDVTIGRGNFVLLSPRIKGIATYICYTGHVANLVVRTRSKTSSSRAATQQSVQFLPSSHFSE